MAYSDEVLADSPLGYWRMGSVSGGQVADASGNSLPLTASGSTTEVSSLLPNVADGALSVSGSSYFQTGNPGSNPTAITVEAWVKPTNSSAVTNIIDRDSSSSPRIFQFRRNGTALEFLWWTTSTGPHFCTAASGSLAQNATHHVAATFDGSIARLYIDGEQVQTTSQSGDLRSGGTLGYGVGVHQNTLFSQKWIGVLDEVAVYPTALSAARIEAHYEAGAGELPAFEAPSPIAGEIEPVGNPVWLAEFEAPSPIGGEIAPFYPEPPPSFAAPSPIRGAIEPFGAGNVPYPTTTVYFKAPSPIGGRMAPSLRPVTPPATINDHPVTVQYHPVPLGPAKQRVTPFADYQPIEGVAGRYRVFVDGQDVTFLRDVPTLVEDYRSLDPMGDVSARFTCRQIDEWDELGAGDLSMFDMDSDPPVDILFEDALGNLTHLWDGHIASEDDYATSNDKGRTFVCEGTLKAAAHQPWTPPTYMEPTDPGIVVARAMNSVISRRYAAIPEVVTGLPPIVFRGSQNQSVLDYAVEVLSHMWTEDGRQWSFIKVGPRQYHLGLKAPMDDYDAAIVKGAEGVDVRIRKDQSQRVDGYFGQGIAPNGGQWGNFFFPGLDLFVPPPYPYSDLTETMSTGDTDAGTSTGRGITDATQRLVELGYLSSATSVYTSTVASAVTRMQRDFGLLVDGRIGPQTWTAMFIPEVGQELNRIRLPLVAKDWVWPTLHAPNGAVTGPNPAHDDGPVPKLPNVNFGSDITKAEATELARRMLEANKDAVYTGSIDLLTDLIAPDGATPISRFLVREGMRIKVLGHPGEPIVRVGDASKDDLSVRLMVDEKARDALTLDAIAERNRDARSAVAPKRPGNPQKISAIMRDHVTQFEDESKAGKIPTYPVNGNVGLWSAFPIFVSQTGQVSKLELRARNVMTTTCIAFWAMPIQPQVLAGYVPNPILDGSGWRDHYETLVLDHGLVAVYGEPGALGGYAPRVQADGGPITGDLFDKSGFPFESWVGGYLWVTVFAGASCNISGVAFPAVPQ